VILPLTGNHNISLRMILKPMRYCPPQQHWLKHPFVLLQSGAAPCSVRGAPPSLSIMRRQLLEQSCRSASIVWLSSVKWLVSPDLCAQPCAWSPRAGLGQLGTCWCTARESMTCQAAPRHSWAPGCRTQHKTRGTRDRAQGSCARLPPADGSDDHRCHGVRSVALHGIACTLTMARHSHINTGLGVVSFIHLHT